MSDMQTEELLPPTVDDVDMAQDQQPTLTLARVGKPFGWAVVSKLGAS